MTRARRRRSTPRRSRRRTRTVIITGILAVVASAGLIIAAWLRATRPAQHEPFRFPTPAQPAPAAAEIEPAERRQLEKLLEGARDDGAAADDPR